MRLALRITVVLALLMSTSCSSDTPRAPVKETLGWIEEIVFADIGVSLDAKLDTGADTSSLHADDIELKELNGDTFVHFSVVTHTGRSKRIKLPLARKAKIKRKLGGIQVRPVVTLGVCLGNTYEQVEFTLVDRSNFEYPVLIGRNFLSGSVIVDSSRSFTTIPQCLSKSAKGSR